MKIKIYILMSLVLLACQKDELMSFQDEKPSVYFYLGDNIYITEITKSFTTTLSDTLIAEIPVKCSSLASDKDRYFKVTVEEEGTTAKAGVDYVPLEQSYLFPAHAYTSSVPVYLIRTRQLADTTLHIRFKLQGSDDFELGEKMRQEANILFSDRLVKPDNWNNWAYGTYSRKKHSVFLIITKRTDYPDRKEFNENYYYFMIALPNAMKAYFKDNYPVLDENGNIIELW